MEIVAFVSEDQVSALRRAAARGDAVLVARSPAAMVAFASAGCRLAVIDHLSIRDDAFRELIEALVSCGAGLILWTKLVPQAMAGIRYAQRSMPVELLFQSAIGDDADLRVLLRFHPAASLPAMVHRAIAPQLHALPLETRVPAVALLGGVPIPRNAEAFARRTRWGMRTGERQFVDCGLTSPSEFLRVARVARSWEALGVRTNSLSDVAALLDSGSEGVLSRDFHRCFGASPRRARASMSTDTAKERLAEYILAPGRR